MGGKLQTLYPRSVGKASQSSSTALGYPVMGMSLGVLADSMTGSPVAHSRRARDLGKRPNPCTQRDVVC
jgi:hypothetical protein